MTSEEKHQEALEQGSSSIQTESQVNQGAVSWKSRLLGGDIYASDDPKKLPRYKRYFYVFLVAVLGINQSIAILIYMPGIYQVMDELNTSYAGFDATTSIYIAFAGIAPLFWSSMSDVYGRKQMYVFSLIISLVASIICAVSKNIVMLIIFRAIQSCGSSSGQTLGAGVVSDLFDVTERGNAYGWFFIGPLFATVIGPTVGGLLCQFLGWRSTFYFTAIFSACLLFMVIFLLPETLRKNRDEMVNATKFKAFKNMGRIFSPMLSMVTDPTVILIAFYNTLVYTCLYILNPSITETFQTVYGFNSWMVGLCYLCLGVGLVFSSVLSGMYADYIMKSLQKKLGAENVDPEMRLKATIPSYFLMPAGYLLYGWSAQYKLGVYAPLIGIFIYGLGQLNSLNPTAVYLVDSKPGRSASAVAINNFARSVVAAIFSVFSTEWVRSRGPGVIFTILAVLNFVNCVPVLLVRFYGKKWRESYEKRQEKP